MQKLFRIMLKKIPLVEGQSNTIGKREVEMDVIHHHLFSDADIEERLPILMPVQ